MPKVSYEFDFYEDREDLEIFQKSLDMSSSIFEVYNLIRMELKHNYHDEKTIRLLERIQSNLYVEGII